MRRLPVPPVTLALLSALTAIPLPAWGQESPKVPPAINDLPKPGSGAISLAEAVQRATARNPTAEVAAKEILRAEALSRQARAAWFPTLVANGAYTRLDADRVQGGRVIAGVNQVSANLQLTVPLIAPTKWVAYARTKDNVLVTRASSVDARRDVAVSAARAYLTVIAQHRVLESAQHALDTARAHEEYAVTRNQGGVGNRLDSVRASQERATAEVQVKTQLTALARAEEALGVAVGEEGSLDAAEDPALGNPTTMEAALSDAAAHRTDIAVQRDRANVARKAVRDSWVDYLPVLSAVAQPFYQNPATPTFPKTGWQAQLLLSLPLYDGGLRYGLADERDAVEAQAKVRLEGVLRQARSEVRIGFDAVRRADEALASARDAAKLAKESLDLAQLAYKAGATTNLEVVDAERRLNEAEIGAAVAEDASRQARLDLLSASGRFP